MSSTKKQKYQNRIQNNRINKFKKKKRKRFKCQTYNHFSILIFQRLLSQRKFLNNHNNNHNKRINMHLVPTIKQVIIFNKSKNHNILQLSWMMMMAVHLNSYLLYGNNKLKPHNSPCLNSIHLIY